MFVVWAFPLFSRTFTISVSDYTIFYSNYRNNQNSSTSFQNVAQGHKIHTDNYRAARYVGTWSNFQHIRESNFTKYFAVV